MVKTTFSGGTPASGAFRAVDVSDSSGIVLDAGFLFSAEFLRSGDDLLLRGADRAEILLRGYFAQHPPPPLETTEGARLTPGIVESLAGPEFPLSRSEEHPSELRSLLHISYAVFCLEKKTTECHHRHTERA